MEENAKQNPNHVFHKKKKQKKPNTLDFKPQPTLTKKKRIGKEKKKRERKFYCIIVRDYST